MSRSLTTVLALLCAVLCACPSVTAVETPSFEAVKRACSAVETLLDRAKFVTNEVQQMFLHGFVSPSNTPLMHQRLLSALQTLLIADQDLTAIRVVTPDLVAILSKQGQIYASNDNASGCSTNGAHSEAVCCVVSPTDQNLRPEPYSQNKSYAWVNTTTPSVSTNNNNNNNKNQGRWQVVNHASFSVPIPSPLLEFSSTIRSKNGAAIGFVGTSISFAAFDSYLSRIYSDTTDNRVVFVVDETVGQNLVGVSTPNNSSHPCNSFSADGRMAVNCDNSKLPEFVSRLASIPVEETDFVVDSGYYALTAPVQDSNSIWRVVVLRPTESVDGIVPFDSPLFYVLCALSCVLIVSSLGLMFWVWKFRHLQLWRMAQRPTLVLFLLCGLACAANTAVSAGQPTRTMCTLREWITFPLFTLFMATILARLLRVHLNLNTRRRHNEAHQMTGRRVLLFVAAVMVFDLILHGVWQLTFPMKPFARYRLSSGDVVEYMLCSSASNAPFYTTRLFPFLIVCFATYVAVLTRHISPMFAESRILLAICLHAIALVAIVVSCYLTRTTTYADALVQMQLALQWFSLTLQMAFFFPRIVRQLDFGDLTVLEIKQMLVQHLDKRKSLTLQLHEPKHKKKIQPSSVIVVSGKNRRHLTNSAHNHNASHASINSDNSDTPIVFVL